MEYTVLLQPQEQEKFLAIVPALPGCRGEGNTREQALANVRVAMAEMLAQMEVVRVRIEEDGEERTSPPDPWLRLIGQFKDDPTFDPMMRRIYKQRSGEYPE